MELTAAQTAWLNDNGLELVQGHGRDFEIKPVNAPSVWSGKSYRYVQVFHVNRHITHYTVNSTGLSHRFGMASPIAREESSHPTLKSALRALVNG